MNQLTDRQKINLIHVLLISPLLLLVLTGRGLLGVQTETLRKLALGVILAGVVAHIYYYVNPTAPIFPK